MGIDVSKGYADFLLLSNDRKVIEEGYTLPDNPKGRQKLKELVCLWQKQGLEELYCGVESTGGYEDNWFRYLRSTFIGEKVYTCRINPKGVKSMGDAALKRTITDAVSAENIASYMISFPHKLDYGIEKHLGNGGFKDGRQHLTTIRMIVKQKVQLNNQLEKLLYQHFAEILVYCRHGQPIWLLSLLVKYPTAAMLIKAGASKISSNKGISPEKAKAIIAKAKNSTQDVSPEIGRIISLTAKEVLHKNLIITKEKEYLTGLYKGAEEMVLLSSIPGVGLDSAVSIALEIEDVGRFETAKKMASYFGVHPTFKQSGDGQWGNHMSKAGRGEIRAVLYMASLSGSRYNPTLKKIYDRYRAQGMKHAEAIGVVMHKLLRMIYGILKNKTKFDADIDQQNQEKSAAKQDVNEQLERTDKKIKQLKKNRFQAVTNEAPISNRKEKAIKKQVASQTS